LIGVNVQLFCGEQIEIQGGADDVFLAGMGCLHESIESDPIDLPEKVL